MSIFNLNWVAEQRKRLATEHANKQPDWISDRPHKIMTREEYDKLNLSGWHKVCHNYDLAGNTAIRYLGD